MDMADQTARPKKKRRATNKPYRREYIDGQGRKCLTSIYHVQYRVNGEQVRESTGLTDYDEAVTYLKRKIYETSLPAAVVSRRAGETTMDQLFDNLVAFYDEQERETLYDLKCMLDAPNGLRKFFGSMKASGVTTDTIDRYKRWRLAERPKPQAATINKAMAYIRRAMNLGTAKHRTPALVSVVPSFRMLPLPQARQGLVTPELYRMLYEKLPEHGKRALVLSYHYGLRLSAALRIEKQWIHLEEGYIEIPVDGPANKGVPRVLPIYGDVGPMVETALRVESRCLFLIERHGKRVLSFYKEWKKAAKAAGVEEVIFHDLRRTAVTNMVDAGFTREEAMRISGHKTEHIFARYHITNKAKSLESAKRLDAHLKKIGGSVSGNIEHSFEHSGNFSSAQVAGK